MKFAIVIPARLESTRMPRKLLQDDTGIPLICHTLQAALGACELAPDLFGRAMVATDSEEILNVVNAFLSGKNLPACAVMTRVDHASGTDRVAEAAESLPDEFTAVLNLQGDEPEMNPADLVRAGRALAAGGEPSASEIVTMGRPLTPGECMGNPNMVKVVTDSDSYALYFSRSPIPYERDPGSLEPGEYLGVLHIGVYVFWRQSLERFVSLPQGRLERIEKLEQLRALENNMRIKVVMAESEPVKGIDTHEDYLQFTKRYFGSQGGAG